MSSTFLAFLKVFLLTWGQLNCSGGCATGSSGGHVSSYSYVVYNDAGVYKAVNQVTGAVDYSGSDAGPVLRSVGAAIAAASSTKAGCAFLMRGVYNVNSLALEAGGSLAYKYAFGGHNSGAGLNGEECWKGESSISSFIYITPTAMATTTSDQYVIGFWGGYSSTYPSNQLTRLSDLSIQFPDGTETRGNTAGVDIRYVNIFSIERVYIRNAQLSDSHFSSTVPVKGSIDSVGFRGPNYQTGGGTMNEVQTHGFYTGFELTELTTARRLHAERNTYPLLIAFDTGQAGQGLGGLVYVDGFLEVFNTHGPVIGSFTTVAANNSDAVAGLILHAYTIERPGNNTGTFARVAMATDSSGGNVSGIIDYNFLTNTTGFTQAQNFFDSGGDCFDITYLNTDAQSHKPNTCMSGGGGTSSVVKAWRTTDQSIAAAASETPVTVDFTGGDLQANSTMHNPSGSGSCGASTNICLPNNSNCTFIFNFYYTPPSTTAARLSAQVKAHDDSHPLDTLSIQEWDEGTATINNFGGTVTGQYHSLTGDYLQVVMIDQHASGSGTLHSGQHYSPTLTVTCN